MSIAGCGESESWMYFDSGMRSLTCLNLMMNDKNFENKFRYCKKVFNFKKILLIRGWIVNDQLNSIPQLAALKAFIETGDYG